MLWYSRVLVSLIMNRLIISLCVVSMMIVSVSSVRVIGVCSCLLDSCVWVIVSRCLGLFVGSVVVT